MEWDCTQQDADTAPQAPLNEDPPLQEDAVRDEEAACENHEVADAEAIAAISEQCLQILRALKKDETHDTQVNNLQKRCLEYEDGIVYARVKGTLQALIKLREDVRRNRNRVEKDLENDADCLEDWRFDMELLQQIADDCVVPAEEPVQDEAPDAELLSQLKAEADAVAKQFGGSEKAPLADWQSERLRLAMVYEHLVSRYDTLLQIVNAQQARIDALCRLCNGEIVRQIRDRVRELCDSLEEKVGEALSTAAYFDRMNDMMDGIAEILIAYGVVIDQTPGDLFVPLTQKVQRTVETDDPALARCVKERLTDRYTYGKTVIFMEKVTVYKYRTVEEPKNQ